MRWVWVALLALVVGVFGGRAWAQEREDQSEVLVPASGAEIDRAFDRLMLSYVLIRDDGGRLVCPVPFVREAIERERKLEDRLMDDVDEWAAGKRRTARGLS